jgi:dGTPase
MLMIREKTEAIEREILSKNAVCAADSKGRRSKEKSCDIRTVFQRDRDRIIRKYF